MRSADKKLLEHLDTMLEDGIKGTFEESSYDETRLSKLETRWLRYLSSSRQSLQKLEQDRAKLNTLVSDISHQTKTPLSNILLYLQLLQEQELGEPARHYIEELQQQSEKLSFLIQALVKTSRLETGTFQLVPTENRLSDLVTDAIAQASPAASAKKICIFCTPTSESLQDIAQFDLKWTAEALSNILDNAVKYSPENSRIEIHIDRYEMYVRISVSDQGVGIPEDEMPKIFGRFYRGNNVRGQSGVGIGLYLSRQIVEGQSGYISVESAEGTGSTFHIYLPK